MNNIILLPIFLVIAFLAGCVAAQPKNYDKFNAANPRSILIVPVINKSAEVSAPDYFLSTITMPIAENGFYVFPVHMVKRILEDEGLYDADLVHSAPAQKVSELFGADSILYITIEEWDAKYLLLTTRVTVKLSYEIRDGKTGDRLWDHQETMVYEPQNSNTGHPLGNLIVMAVNAAITRAAPNYIPLATQANINTFTYPGPGIPLGPYAKAN